MARARKLAYRDCPRNLYASAVKPATRVTGYLPIYCPPRSQTRWATGIVRARSLHKCDSASSSTADIEAPLFWRYPLGFDGGEDQCHGRRAYAALRTERLPEGPDWVHELEFDGYHAVAIKTVGSSASLRERQWLQQPVIGRV